MAFRIADQDAPDGMFIGAEQPTHSIRTGRDNEGTALVVLGPRFNTGQETDVARRFRELADWAAENFKVGEAAWRWANEDMETADCLPYVGPLKPDNPNFYVATGFNGWGIPNGTAAGLLVAAPTAFVELSLATVPAAFGHALDAVFLLWLLHRGARSSRPVMPKSSFPSLRFWAISEAER